MTREDRAFRSALDALQQTESFRARGVSLHLLDLGGDIAGNRLSRLFMTIAAAFAELERDRIRERITQVKRDQKARHRFSPLPVSGKGQDADQRRGRYLRYGMAPPTTVLNRVTPVCTFCWSSCVSACFFSCSFSWRKRSASA